MVIIMKIEKVNDHQIRCTLTGADLANRELKISELAYGSEKAKRLFRDMMQQANFEFGFEAEDIPLMIEAIPVNADCIVLIITKVEDPEELDTRFSNFSPALNQEDMGEQDFAQQLSGAIAEDVYDLFQKIKNSAKGNQTAASSEESSHKPAMADSDKTESGETIYPRCLITRDLNDLIRFSKVVASVYQESNYLLKDNEEQTYYLVLTRGDLDIREFGQIVNIASEYGDLELVSAAKYAYMEDSYQMILEKTAINSLAKI